MKTSLKIYLNVCVYIQTHVYIYMYIHTDVNTLIYMYVLCKYVYKKPFTSASWDNSKIIFTYREIINSN